MTNTFMQEAITQAKIAYRINEVPVGAVVVRNNKIISFGHNLRENNNDSTMHAEIVAIQKACNTLNTWKLNDCDIYVTLEPCLMCAGAILNSRIRRLYYGAVDKKMGAVESVTNTFNQFSHIHKIEVYSGIMEEECKDLIISFFKSLRYK